MTQSKNIPIRQIPQSRLTPARAAGWERELPAPGPFEPQVQKAGRGNDMVRALATGMLVMYPVVAILVTVVAASLLLGLGAPA